MKQTSEYDMVIVGAGVIGLAHAWQASRRGLRVLVLEESARAQGASVRNFGMVWPVGQPPGERFDLARRSAELWKSLAAESGIWYQPCGSLHLAFREDEWAVLEEFQREHGSVFETQLLSPEETIQRSPAVRSEGLLGSLWSPWELGVNPRRVIGDLPKWLTDHQGVEFRFGTRAVAVDETTVIDPAGNRYQGKHVILATGAAVSGLFPQWFNDNPVKICKLQMLRTAGQPGGFRTGPHLAGGLTLRHYETFAACPSLAALKARIAEESPELDRYGIHVMVSQNEAGEAILGDSHEYGEDVTPFDSAEIDRLILRELHRMVDLPTWEIQQTWHGIYAKHATRPYAVDELAPSVWMVNGFGGAGMTLSMGLAEQVCQQLDLAPQSV